MGQICCVKLSVLAAFRKVYISRKQEHDCGQVRDTNRCMKKRVVYATIRRLELVLLSVDASSIYSILFVLRRIKCMKLILKKENAVRPALKAHLRYASRNATTPLVYTRAKQIND